MLISQLSSKESTIPNEASGLIMVGSFAPVHEGHFDAMRSAERAMSARGDSPVANIFVPNSDSYVLKKLNDDEQNWNYSTRISHFLVRDSFTEAPSFVDDITGLSTPELTISESAIKTASLRLGMQASKLVLVVGTDQLASMRPHLETNRAICILRPGYEKKLQEHSEEGWFVEGVDSGQYILADREHIDRDISSTDIRNLSKKTTVVQL